MSNGEYLVKKLIEDKEKLSELLEKISETESNLSGMEITYKDMWALVEYVDANRKEASLVVGNNGEIHKISLDELLRIMS